MQSDLNSKKCRRKSEDTSRMEVREGKRPPVNSNPPPPTRQVLFSPWSHSRRATIRPVSLHDTPQISCTGRAGGSTLTELEASQHGSNARQSKQAAPLSSASVSSVK